MAIGIKGKVAIVMGSAAMLAVGLFLVLPNRRIRDLSLAVEDEGQPSPAGSGSRGA